MFIHIGGSQIVFCSDLVGIFNYNLSENDINRNLIDNHLTGTGPIRTNADRPKSFVVTNRQVYTSPISPLTLSRRRSASR